MKTLLLATAAMFMALPAHALLISSASAPGLLPGACAATDGGTPGAINTSCNGGIFSNIALTAGGPPDLHAPDLTATALTVTTTGAGQGPVTLDIAISSQGFVFPGGPVTALFTVNNLIGGGPGPFVLSITAPVGTISHTFTGSGSETDGPTVLAPFTNDAAEFALTFLGDTIQSIDATIEIVGVPAAEPGSLALMGVGLVGLGWIVSRRRTVSSQRPA